MPPELELTDEPSPDLQRIGDAADELLSPRPYCLLYIDADGEIRGTYSAVTFNDPMNLTRMALAMEDAAAHLRQIAGKEAP